MVKKTSDNGDGVFVCEACGFKYAEKELAEKCEAWCKEHHSCNLEITKHAIQPRSEQK